MNKKVYVYVGAEWCPKCKVYKPKFEEYCKKNELSYKIVDADNDDDAKFFQLHGVRNIPVVVEIDPLHSDLKGKIIEVTEFIKE